MYVIPVYGEIGVEFKREDLLMHINKSGQEPIHLDVNSVGGYVDVADDMIEDLKKTGRVISSSNSGDVASAAVGIFLIPEWKENRTFYHNKGAFLIHNPFAEVKGDSDKMIRASSVLKSIESKYSKMYSEKTNSDIDVIKSFMSINKPLTGEQIQELGFATVQTYELKAVAKFNINNQKMEVEMKKEFEKMENSLFSKIKGLFKPKCLMVTDANGVELNMPDIEDASQIAVGVKIEAEDGSYVQSDGTTLVVVGGEITEILPAEKVDEEMEALKAENEALKAELESAKAEAKATLECIQADFKSLKAKMSGYKPAMAKPATEEKEVKSFNFKRK